MSAPPYDAIIQQHYDDVARRDGSNPASTMADDIIRRKETEIIFSAVAAFLRKQTSSHQSSGGYEKGPGRRFHIADIGCGNGYTLDYLASHMPESMYTGIEFNSSLRRLAKERAAKNQNMLIFDGDIRTCGTLYESHFDVVISQRVLINLLDPADQKHAIENLVTILRPGGALICIEAFESGWENLNAARAEFGFEPIPQAHHNLYLKDDAFDIPPLEALDLGENHIPMNALSTHYYVSRVLHELALRITGQDFIRNSHFVSFLSQALPDAIGNYSPLRICLLRRRL